MSKRSSSLLLPCLTMVCLLSVTCSANEIEVDGFTEPYRDIDVAELLKPYQNIPADELDEFSILDDRPNEPSEKMEAKK